MKRAKCGYCRRPIFLARSGDWYHERNSSVSCNPGAGTGRKAFPRGEDAPVPGGPPMREGNNPRTGIAYNE